MQVVVLQEGEVDVALDDRGSGLVIDRGGHVELPPMA